LQILGVQVVVDTERSEVVVTTKYVIIGQDYYILVEFIQQRHTLATEKCTYNTLEIYYTTDHPLYRSSFITHKLLTIILIFKTRILPRRL
jgi:hypothetical protein